MRGLRGEIDVVMVHNPQLTARALQELKEDPPSGPLVLLVGHTHTAAGSATARRERLDAPPAEGRGA